MNSNASTVLLFGIGPYGTPALMVTLGFAPSGVEPITLGAQYQTLMRSGS